MDEQLPPALAEWLRARGHEGLHVLETGLGGASDTVIFSFASQENYVIITKDADFAIRRKQGTPVVWLHLGNLPTRLLLGRFAQAFDEVREALEQGERLIEIA
ncbi:MAG: DUF5615 family PIN-like protein [Beijerinckiaceae bacterium]